MRKFACVVLMTAAAAASADDAQIQKNLDGIGLDNISVSASPLPGLRTVISDQGIFYVSDNGEYVIQGSLIRIKDGEIEDLTNRPLMAKLGEMEKEMIIYPAKDEKHVVTVFTDITCPYCSKLHREVKNFNDLGITVRYLAFPRAGADSEAARQMETIWQSEDRNAALDDAELNRKTPAAAASADLIRRQFILGHQFGVSGTPAIVMEDGQIIPGFVKPKELLSLLERN